MKQYLDLVQHVLENGDKVDTERTGVGTISTFGEQIKFDLRKGFPAVTTKKLAWKGVVSELIWFLSGSSNLYDLRAILHGEESRYHDGKKTIWDGNYNKQAKDLGYEFGEMGDIYGKQWRDFGAGDAVFYDSDYGMEVHKVKGVDQVKLVIEEAKVNPQSRRLLVSAWNPKVVWDYKDNAFEVKKAALPPCHYAFQLNIIGDYIDLSWTQRSQDLFLGAPFNIASYATLLHIFGRILGKIPRYLVGALGNVHIYDNHVTQCREQLTRSPLKEPEIWINPELKTLDDFVKAKVEDFKLIGYEHHPALTGDMAV